MVAMLVAGPVSDRIGRKHIFTGLIASMALGSAALGLTTGSRPPLSLQWASSPPPPRGRWRARCRPWSKTSPLPDEAGRMLGLSLFPDRGRHTVWSTAARSADGEPYVARFLHAGGAARHRRTGRRDAVSALLAPEPAERRSFVGSLMKSPRRPSVRHYRAS